MLSDKQWQAIDDLLAAADREFEAGNEMKAMEALRDAVVNTLADIARAKGWPHADYGDLHDVAEWLNEKDDLGNFMSSGYSAADGFPDKVRYGFFDMADGDADDSRLIARSYVKLARELVSG